MKSLESYDGKLIIVTFEMPVTTNNIQKDNCILINWLIKQLFWNIKDVNSLESFTGLNNTDSNAKITFDLSSVSGVFSYYWFSYCIIN